MSDTGNTELERRLAALEKGSARAPIAAQRRSPPLLALVVVLVIGAGGALLYLLSQPEEEEALPTATPDVFQNEGDGFGAIEALPPPEPEVVFVGPDPRRAQRGASGADHRPAGPDRGVAQRP